MSYLELENITKRYGDTTAVQSITLSVDERQLLVILGPSGCGKSTLLRLVSGLERPDEGNIMLHGSDITDTPPKDRNIAMVFQDYALYPHMTVEKNLTFGLTIRHMEKREAKRRAREAAALLGIEKLLARKPEKLSGGEKQRVALGRAIVKEPSIFLMDEPLSNVDALLRGKMRAEIVRIMRDVGGTLLYVTHDQAEAMTVGDRLAVMKEGMILQVGTPHEVYARPKNIFVASFVGTPSMNFIEPEAKFHKTLLNNSAVGKTGKRENDLSPGTVMGIRPEDIIIGRGPYRGRVIFVEELGHESHVTVDAEGTSLVIRAPDNTPRIDEVVSFSVDADTIHRFDKKSGNRGEGKA
jgi:multiple sugar transport system ATP-binding protein